MNEHLKTQQLKKSGQLRSMPKCQPLDPSHAEGSGAVGTLQPSCINTTRASPIATSKPLTEKMKENCHNAIQQMEWPKGINSETSYNIPHKIIICPKLSPIEIQSFF